MLSLRNQLRTITAMFITTGATALIAEQVFEKALSTMVGASAPAAAVVLATYFLGLSMGGFLYSRWGGAYRFSAWTAYAVLEGCVGIWALLLWLGQDLLAATLVPLLALGVDHPMLLALLRGAVAAIWILPVTVPMGATFPAVTHILAELRVPKPRRMTTRVYTFNLFGAVLGAVAGPYLIFPSIGIRSALLGVFVANGTVALLAARIGRASRVRGRQQDHAPVAPRGGPVEVQGATVLYIVSGISGLLFFALEVVWTHLIATVLGSSVYAFATMLSVVLISLALGGVLASVLVPGRREVPAWIPGLVLVMGGLLLGSQHLQWPFVPHTLATSGASITTFTGAELLRWREAAQLLIPPALLLGMVFPMLFRLGAFPLARRGAVAGRIVAFNSLGSILGALTCGFYLIPAVGSEHTLRILTVGCLVAGVLLAIRYATRAQGLLVSGIAVVVVAVLGLQPPWDRLELTSGEQVYFRPGHVNASSVLRFFHEDTYGGITTVVENKSTSGRPRETYKVLLTNGKFQGNDGGEMEAQSAFALIPMLFVSRFDRALIVGLGTGHSGYVVGAMGFSRVDIAEIAPGIVAAARQEFAGINGRLLSHTQVHLFLEDGRNLLLLRPERYDLVTAEVSSVWFAGSTNLYSRDFYQTAANRLQPGGVLQQWIQIHHIGDRELLCVIATMRSVFPYVSFWVVGGQGLVVGTMEPQLVKPAFSQSIVNHHVALGWPSTEIQTRVADLLSSRLLGPEDVDRIQTAQEDVINTDANRWLEYSTPRYNTSQLDHLRENLKLLSERSSFSPPTPAPGVDRWLVETCRSVSSSQIRERFRAIVGRRAR